MSKGKLLEILVKQIETSLKEREQVRVTTDTKVKDKDGVFRQIDVLITIEFGERLGKAYTIIECKDKGRKAEVGEVGSFINLIESIPECTRGLFVSRKGFNSGAVTKADATKKVELIHMKSDVENIVDKIFCSNVAKIGYEIPEQQFRFQMKTSDPNKSWNSMEELEETMLFNNHFAYQGYSPIEWPFIIGQKNSTVLIKSLQGKAVELAQKSITTSREEFTLSFPFDEDWYVNTKGFHWTPITCLSIIMLVDFKAIPSLKFTLYEYQKLNKKTDATVELFEFPHHYLQVVIPQKDTSPRFFVIMKNDLTNITEIVKLKSFLDRPIVAEMIKSE